MNKPKNSKNEKVSKYEIPSAGYFEPKIMMDKPKDIAETLLQFMVSDAGETLRQFMISECVNDTSPKRLEKEILESPDNFSI